jgi:hypothetical protein
MPTEARIDAPVPGLPPSARPRDARALSLERGALDPIFRASHFRQDLALSRRPKDFHGTAPFGATAGATAGASTAHKASGPAPRTRKQKGGRPQLGPA